MGNSRRSVPAVAAADNEPMVVIQNGKVVGTIDERGQFVPVKQPKHTPLGRQAEELTENLQEALPCVLEAGEAIHRFMHDRYQGQPMGRLRGAVADFFLDVKINGTVTDMVNTYLASMAQQAGAYAADQAAFYDLQRELALEAPRGELERQRSTRRRDSREADLVLEYEHGSVRQAHELKMIERRAQYDFRLKLEELRVTADAQSDQQEHDHELTLEVLRLGSLLPEALAEIETLPAEKAGELMAALEVVSNDFDALIQESSAQVRRQKAAALLPILTLLLKQIAMETMRPRRKRPAHARRKPHEDEPTPDVDVEA